MYSNTVCLSRLIAAVYAFVPEKIMLLSVLKSLLFAFSKPHSGNNREKTVFTAAITMSAKEKTVHPWGCYPSPTMDLFYWQLREVSRMALSHSIRGSIRLLAFRRNQNVDITCHYMNLKIMASRQQCFDPDLEPNPT